MNLRKNLPGSRIRQNLYSTDREIEKMCLEALKASGFLPDSPQPIDIESFVEKHFETDLDFATELDKGVLGWTLFGGKGEIMMVGVSPELSNDSSEMGNRRCRATVAHEAGHCLMHPILFLEDTTQSLAENLDFKNNRILCRKDDFGRPYDGRWWEVQANKAIGEFLLPKSLVRIAVSEFLVTRGVLGIETLPADNLDVACKHVADVFEVNLTPAKIRLEKLFPDSDENFL